MCNHALDNKSVTDLVSSNAQIKVAGVDVVHASFVLVTHACLKETRLCSLVGRFRCMSVRQLLCNY